MSRVNIFGRYNWIYCLKGEHGIEFLCDRAHDKKPVLFEERPLEDLAAEPRATTNLHVTSVGFPAQGGLASEDEVPGKSETIEDRVFQVLGDECSSFATGFGRGLRYRAVRAGDDRIAILLTVGLPDQARYRIRWNALRREGARFDLPEAIQVTILTSLPWSFSDSTLIAESGDESGDITFLIESVIAHSDVFSAVVVARAGLDRLGVLARAACGRGFVPCFVWDEMVDPGAEKLRRFLSAGSYGRILCVGSGLSEQLAFKGAIIDVPTETESSVTVSRTLGHLRRRMVVAPNSPDAYGPALYLAIANDADLCFSGPSGSSIALQDQDDQITKRWDLSALIGNVLNALSIDGRSDGREIVLTENTTDDLLVCQAVGYASFRAAPIAFVPAMPKGFLTGDLNAAAVVARLQEVSDQTIPRTLRSPAAERLTIFSERWPLHLTPIPDADQSRRLTCWADRYVISHLPGHTASVLMLRLFAKTLREAPAIPYALIFDALDDVRRTEGRQVARHLEKALAHPLLLAREGCTRDLLRELANRLATEFILLITHGAGDYIEDAAGNPITAKEIAEWTLKGHPFVFNNSCSSWFTTGQAFLDAGARGLVATLWPVGTERAGEIAAHLGEQLAARPDASLPMLLADAVRDGSSAADDTRLSYVYVGLPDTRPVIRPPLGGFETISFCSSSLLEIDQFTQELALGGRPDLAMLIRDVSREPLRCRFLQLLEQGQLAPHLPPPFQLISILDVDYLLAQMDVQLAQSILAHTAAEQQGEVIKWLDDRLHTQLRELTEWNERHDRHMGRSRALREMHSREMGLPFAAISEGVMYREFVTIAYRQVLPFIKTLVGHKLRSRAEHWLRVAGILVCVPQDLSPNRTVADDALIRRVQGGNKEKMRVYIPNGENHNTEVEIDHLDQCVNRAELLNRFGIACLDLGKVERARRFFEAALSLAAPGTTDHANLSSNLNRAECLARGSSASVERYIETISIQEKHGDFANACVSAANLIQLSAQLGAPVDAKRIASWLLWAGNLPRRDLQIDMRCRLLGACACLAASQRDLARVRALCEEIARYISGEFPQSSVPLYLNGVLSFLDESGQHEEVVAQARRNADMLERAGLPDVALRTRLHACLSANRLLEGAEQRRFLPLFLDCSEHAGAALRKASKRDADLDNFIDVLWSNTRSLWQQATEMGDTRLAVRAYGCVKTWDPRHASDDWELLHAAYHELNIIAIKSLAKRELLRRRVSITLTKSEIVHASVVTERLPDRVESSRVREPRRVYSLMSIRDMREVSADSSEVRLLAGSAVFALEESSSVAISGYLAGHVRTDHQGGYLYRDFVGSALIAYDIIVALEPGLVPLFMMWNEDPANLEGTKVELTRQGFRLLLNTSPSLFPTVRSAGRLNVYYVANEKLWNALRHMDMFDKGPIDFPLWCKLAVTLQSWLGEAGS